VGERAIAELGGAVPSDPIDPAALLLVHAALGPWSRGEAPFPTVSDLARRTGLAPATVRRLVDDLTRIGYVADREHATPWTRPDLSATPEIVRGTTSGAPPVATAAPDGTYAKRPRRAR